MSCLAPAVSGSIAPLHPAAPNARHRKVSGRCLVASDYHHLYCLSAWRKLRERQLHAEPLCRMHMAIGQIVPATVVDHVRPHRGDEALFFDERNVQSLCKPCHDGHKQAQERGDGILRGAGHDGEPLDLAHPWYAAPAGGGAISAPHRRETGPDSLCAGRHNGQGGASA